MQTHLAWACRRTMKVVICECASKHGSHSQHMRAADLESDSLIRNALICTSDALCFCQNFLAHLIKVIEALACKKEKLTCMHFTAEPCRHLVQRDVPGKCKNSPQSLPPVLDLTSCNTSGLRVQISGPLGRKSLPTCRSTDSFRTPCKLGYSKRLYTSSAKHVHTADGLQHLS